MKRKSKRIKYFVLILVFILISFIPYYIFWGSNTISSIVDDWTFFFVYVQSIVSPVIVLISIYLAYESLEITIDKNNEDVNLEKDKIKKDDIHTYIEKQSILIDEYINKSFYNNRYVTKDKKAQYEHIRYIFKDMYIVNKDEANTSKYYIDDECKITIDIGHYFIGFILHIDALLNYIEDYSALGDSSELIRIFYKNKYSAVMNQFVKYNDYFVQYYYEFFRKELDISKKVIDHIINYFNIEKIV